MSAFHFLRPWWFLVLPPLLGLLWLVCRQRLQSRSWQDFCDPELLPHLLIGGSRRRAFWPLWLFVIGLLLSVTALAGPTWNKRPQPLLKQKSGLIIALDLSRSMLAADLKPSRLVRARLKIEDILRQRREGQTALVVFAGDAFAVTPLTEDVNTIQALLGSLEPGLMPVQGSRPDRAFSVAAGLLERSGMHQGVLLLVTDEDRPERDLEAARELAKKGLELAVLGVGTADGAPIPVDEGGFFKDRQGNLVLPRLEEDGLRELARAGGGQFRRIAIDDSDFEALLSGLDSRELGENEEGPKRTGDLWQDAGVWLLWPLAILVAAAFRRGWLLVVLLVMLQPQQAAAFGWSDLWQNGEQQAYEAFKREDYATAAEKFNDPRWRSSSLYRAGDYQKALEALPEPQTADDWYNQGNMLARSGQLQEALEAYDQALERNPEDADARANRQVVEDALKRQQKQQSQPQQNGQEEQQRSDRENEKQQGPAQQKKDDSKSGQEQSDGQQAESSASRQPQAPDQLNEEAQGQQQQNKQMSRQKKSNAELQEKEPESSRGQKLQAGEDDLSQTPEELERERLLRQIPDDPGGLMRRKFLYQYRQRGEQQESDRPW